MHLNGFNIWSAHGPTVNLMPAHLIPKVFRRYRAAEATVAISKHRDCGRIVRTLLPLLWCRRSRVTGQAHRLFQVLLSRILIWSGGCLHPSWAAEEGKQRLVDRSKLDCTSSTIWRSPYQPDPITGRERNRFAIEVDSPAVLLFNTLNASN